MARLKSTDLNDVLNIHPVGTHDFDVERRLIVVLHELCRQYGYGNITRIARDIEAIHRDPSEIDRFKLAKLVRQQVECGVDSGG